MKKNITYILLALVLIITTATSCRKDREVGGTEVESLSGEWWVEYQIVDQDGEVVYPYSGDYFLFTTYNTAANKASEMFVDDGGSFWDFKGKVNVNVNDKTFSATDAQNISYDSHFSIIGGKVITDGTVGPGSGAKTDSISFSATFDDDDDNLIYQFRGYKRTSWAEDDH